MKHDQRYKVKVICKNYFLINLVFLVLLFSSTMVIADLGLKDNDLPKLKPKDKFIATGIGGSNTSTVLVETNNSKTVNGYGVYGRDTAMCYFNSTAINPSVYINYTEDVNGATIAYSDKDGLSMYVKTYPNGWLLFNPYESNAKLQLGFMKGFPNNFLHYGIYENYGSINSDNVTAREWLVGKLDWSNVTNKPAIGSDNSSWNQSFAELLFAPIKWDYNQSTPFYNWLTTYVPENSTFNEARTNTLYASILWNYNQTTPFQNWVNSFAYNYNQTYTDGTYNSTYNTYAYNQSTASNKSIVETYNPTWSSTYNITYQNFAYNQTAYLLQANNTWTGRENNFQNVTIYGNVTLRGRVQNNSMLNRVMCWATNRQIGVCNSAINSTGGCTCLSIG